MMHYRLRIRDRNGKWRERGRNKIKAGERNEEETGRKRLLLQRDRNMKKIVTMTDLDKKNINTGTLDFIIYF